MEALAPNEPKYRIKMGVMPSGHLCQHNHYSGRLMAGTKRVNTSQAHREQRQRRRRTENGTGVFAFSLQKARGDQSDGSATLGVTSSTHHSGLLQGLELKAGSQQSSASLEHDLALLFRGIQLSTLNSLPSQTPTEAS